jgi:hypothetical protein
VLLACGCATSEPAPAPRVAAKQPAATPKPSAAECVVPLAEFCQPRGRLCEWSFEEDVDALRTRLATGGDWGASSAEIGRCGEYRAIRTGGGLGGTTAFYDASGRRIGGTSFSDAPTPWCGKPAFGGAYGLVPTCTVEVEERIEASRR